MNDNITATEGWTGTFKHMDGDEIAGKYILNTSGDKMVKAGTGAWLAPYHCYLELPADMNAAALTVMHRNETTGVGKVLQENMYSKEIMFDLNGKRVKNTSAGDVIIKNNKKIYIK